MTIQSLPHKHSPTYLHIHLLASWPGVPCRVIAKMDYPVKLPPFHGQISSISCMFERRQSKLHPGSLHPSFESVRPVPALFRGCASQGPTTLEKNCVLVTVAPVSPAMPTGVTQENSRDVRRFPCQACNVDSWYQGSKISYGSEGVN